MLKEKIWQDHIHVEIFLGGDLCLVPFNFAYNVFAIERERRIKGDLSSIDVQGQKDWMIETLVNGFFDEVPLNKIRIGLEEKNGWQNLEGRLIKGIVSNDFSRFTDLDFLRYNLLLENCNGF